MSDVFDGVMAMDNALQKIRRISELQRSIWNVGKECGDCDHWMKSLSCPKERNVNGRNEGPSWGDRVCSKYVEKPSATERRTRLEKQLKDLEETE